MPDPILYVFSISHYCEKARWALDYLGVRYRPQILVPGAHVVLTKKLGVARSSLPILLIGDEAIQGSSAIIDWAEQHARAGRPSLNPEPWSAEAKAIEQRLDTTIGVHVRRMFYSEALVEHQQTVKPVFAEGLSLLETIKLGLMWPLVRKKMIALMDLGAEQGLESKALVETELDWLDDLLSDNREYLVGDRFSRVDITAASLLARMVAPAEHPAQEKFKLPPRAQQDANIWKQRPVIRWVKKMYARHRR